MITKPPLLIIHRSRLTYIFPIVHVESMMYPYQKESAALKDDDSFESYYAFGGLAISGKIYHDFHVSNTLTSVIKPVF